MGWKVVKVEKGVLNVVRGFLTYIFKKMLFPDLIPEDLDISAFHIHFGDDPRTLVQILSKDEEDEISIYV